MESKPIYQSKTFWVNVIMAVAIPLLPESIKVYFSPENIAYFFAGVNMLLRLISKGKVELW